MPPGLRHHGGRVDRPARRDRGQMRPAARHHVHYRIAASAERDPAAVRVLVRQVVAGLRHRTLGVQAHREMRQRILEVGVRTVLRHDHLRPEGPQQLRHHRMKGPQPALVPGSGRQRHIHRGALRALATGLLRPAGLREERPRMLVQRDGQYPRVLPERRLHPVAVVHIHIDVRDPLGTQLQQPGDRQRGVVVDTETGRPARHRMVQSAGEVHRMHAIAAPDGLRGTHRLAGDQRRCLVHPHERRVVRRPQPVREVRGGGIRRGSADRADEVLAMHQPQGGVPGRLGRDHLQRPAVQLVRLHQTHGQREPDRVHRMPGPEVVARYCLIPHQLCAAAHIRHRIGPPAPRTSGHTPASPAPGPSAPASLPDNSRHHRAHRPAESRSKSPHS